MTHNVIVNGDFETGDLMTGWTVSDVTGDATAYAHAWGKYSGNYGLYIDVGSSVGNTVTISQQIPIYNATMLNMKFDVGDINGGHYVSCKVMIDSTVLYTMDVTTDTWIDLNLDVSAFNGGIHTLKFVAWRNLLT